MAVQLHKIDPLGGVPSFLCPEGVEEKSLIPRPEAAEPATAKSLEGRVCVPKSLEELHARELFRRVSPDEWGTLCSGVDSVEMGTAYQRFLRDVDEGIIPDVRPRDLAYYAVKALREEALSEDTCVTLLMYSYAISLGDAGKDFFIEPITPESETTLKLAVGSYFSPSEVKEVVAKVETVPPIQRYLILCREYVRPLLEALEGNMTDIEFRKHFLRFTLNMLSTAEETYLLLLPPAMQRLLLAARFEEPIGFRCTLGYSKKWEDVSGDGRVLAIPSAVTTFRYGRHTEELVHGRKGNGAAMHTHDVDHLYIDSGNPWRAIHDTLAAQFAKKEMRVLRNVFADKDFEFFAREDVARAIFLKPLTQQQLFWVSIAVASIQCGEQDDMAKPHQLFLDILQVLDTVKGVPSRDVIPGLSRVISQESKMGKELTKALVILESVAERERLRALLTTILHLIHKTPDWQEIERQVGLLFMQLPRGLTWEIYGELFKYLRFHTEHPQAGEFAFWMTDGHKCTNEQREVALTGILKRVAS